MGNRASRVASQGQKVVSQHSQQLREQIEKQVIEDIKAEHVTKQVGARMSQFEIKTRSGVKEQEAPDTLKNRDKLQADPSTRLSAQDIAHILSSKEPHQIDYLRSHINYPLINDNVATYRD